MLLVLVGVSMLLARHAQAVPPQCTYAFSGSSSIDWASSCAKMSPESMDKASHSAASLSMRQCTGAANSEQTAYVDVKSQTCSDGLMKGAKPGQFVPMAIVTVDFDCYICGGN